MTKHVRVNRVLLFDVIGSHCGWQRQHLYDHFTVAGSVGAPTNLHFRDGIGPVRAWVWQVRPKRLGSIAVRHVRGEAAGFAVERHPGFFHEFATRKVMQRFTRLPRSAWKKSGSCSLRQTTIFASMVTVTR